MDVYVHHAYTRGLARPPHLLRTYYLTAYTYVHGRYYTRILYDVSSRRQFYMYVCMYVSINFALHTTLALDEHCTL